MSLACRGTEKGQSQIPHSKSLSFISSPNGRHWIHKRIMIGFGILKDHSAGRKLQSWQKEMQEAG
jgi:hypothetical protein